MDNPSLRIDGANCLRSIHGLVENIGNLGEDTNSMFYNYLFQLLQLHRRFYRYAVKILIEESGEFDGMDEYIKEIRMEQLELIKILRGMKRKETLLERIGRNQRVKKLVEFLETCIDDIMSDWKIDPSTNQLIFSSEEQV